jgi:hypothetical protein
MVVSHNWESLYPVSRINESNWSTGHWIITWVGLGSGTVGCDPPLTQPARVCGVAGSSLTLIITIIRFFETTAPQAVATITKLIWPTRRSVSEKIEEKILEYISISNSKLSRKCQVRDGNNTVRANDRRDWLFQLDKWPIKRSFECVLL